MGRGALNVANRPGGPTEVPRVRELRKEPDNCGDSDHFKQCEDSTGRRRRARRRAASRSGARGAATRQGSPHVGSCSGRDGTSTLASAVARFVRIRCNGGEANSTFSGLDSHFPPACHATERGRPRSFCRCAPNCGGFLANGRCLRKPSSGAEAAVRRNHPAVVQGSHQILESFDRVVIVLNGIPVRNRCKKSNVRSTKP